MPKPCRICGHDQGPLNSKRLCPTCAEHDYEVVVGRHQEGVVLNPLEFLLTSDGTDYFVFEHEVAAKTALARLGVSLEVIDSLYYIPAMCIN